MMQTQRKYQKVNADQPNSQIDILRINTRTDAGHFVKRAIQLLQGSKNDDQIDPLDTITLTAIDNAIPKTLIIAEVIRRRVANLYQIYDIGTAEITERYIPTEEGLLEVKITRLFASISIKLTKTPTEVDKKAAGFHEPLTSSEMLEDKGYERKGHNYRGERPQRSIGGKYQNRGQQDNTQNQNNYDRYYEDYQYGHTRDTRDSSYHRERNPNNNIENIDRENRNKTNKRDDHQYRDNGYTGDTYQRNHRDNRDNKSDFKSTKRDPDRETRSNQYYRQARDSGSDYESNQDQFTKNDQRSYLKREGDNYEKRTQPRIEQKKEFCNNERRREART